MFKKIKRFFKNWLQRWKDYFQMRTNDRLSAKLYKSLLKETEERTRLKKDIVAYMQTEWKVSPKSKHIPLNLRRKIVEAIYQKFRKRMEPLQLKVNNNLQFVK